MGAHQHSHHTHHASKRLTRPAPVPEGRLPYLTTPEVPTVVRRDGSSSTPTCSGNSCQKSSSNSMTNTLPVVLGAVIPIVCALVVLFFLHRRHVKKLRNEDVNDKYKSLDFGMDMANSAAGRGDRVPKAPEMALTAHSKRGLSLDMISSPYLLPPGVHNSRESLHSLSRNMNGDDDKYRHVTNFIASDSASLHSYRSNSRMGQDDASSISPSMRQGPGEDIHKGLLKNAQRMSITSPPSDYRSHELTPSPESDKQESLPSRRPSPLAQQSLDTPIGDAQVSNRMGNAEATMDVEKSNQSNLGPVIDGGDHHVSQNIHEQSSFDHHPSSQESDLRLGQAMTTHEPVQSDFRLPPNNSVSFEPLSIPHIQEPQTFDHSAAHPSSRDSIPLSDEASDYGDDHHYNSTLPAVSVSVEGEQFGFHPEGQPNHSNRATQQFPDLNYGYDPHRLTVGIRPLPPEDPSDNPEQRANRIRSFYKEYFDDSKPAHEDYYYYDDGGDAYDDGFVYDPATGEYLTGPPKPFAQPVGRRAMTPPPRAPPQFRGPPRHMPSASSGGFMPPEARPYSSASGHLPRRGPRKPRPPPAPLHVLPSPHLLKDDMSIMPIDFAPGKNFKDQREGRPETPQGGLRPFTPTARAHTPLVSSFDDLAAIPSPHLLRKSGVFTSLDFAPVPRFKNSDTMSDAGSIRSNRTGISAVHSRNIRAGAYRISRLPTETVGTKDDLSSSLRPKWDMR